MDISPRKPAKRIPEPVDEWLHAEGYFRKHAPRDPTCLFRAVSEQVYLTQHFHLRVRQECVNYMRDNRDLFEEDISIPFESYLEQMSYFTEWGGSLEIKAMSLLYRHDIVMFNGPKLTRQLVTSHGFKKMIYLCHIPPKQYETVYERDFISTAAFCQSIVYQTLYKDVFQMTDVDNTVFKMLHERSSNVSHDKFFLKENLPIREQLTVELLNKLGKNGEEDEEPQTEVKSITPFPYRIAKALDPNIYRNTDFDIWHEIRREIRNAGWMKYNSSDLQVGGKCLVQMDTKEDEQDNANNNFTYPINIGEKSAKDNNGNDSMKSAKKSVKKDPLIYSGHIQEMGKNEGPVVVFIEELGEKKTVPYSSLKPINQKKNKQTNWPVINQKKNTIFDSGNQRWKKSNWYSSSKKIKDLAMNLNSLTPTQTDKNNNKIQSQDVNQWDNESGHSDESSLSYKTYTMERLTAYQGYAVNTSVDVMPVSVVLDASNPNVIESLQFETSKDDEDNASDPSNTGDMSKTANDSAEKQSMNSSISTITSETPSCSSQTCNRNAQNEIYYSGQPGITQYLAGNGSIYFPAAECNIVPSPQFFINNNSAFPPPSMESLHPAGQVNQVLQTVNTSAVRSTEANYSDLPLTDLATLRFFYNLGVEYFRANCSLMGCGSAQAMSFGTCYISTGNSAPSPYNNPTGSNLAVNEVTSNEVMPQICENFQQKVGISQQQGDQTGSNREFSPNNGKGQGQGGRNMNPNNHGFQKPMTRNDSHNVPENKNLSQNLLAQQSSPYSPNNEKIKDLPTPNKDNQRTNRNSLAPRFKKNFDGRYRNSRQQQQQHQQQQAPQQQQPQQNQQQQVFRNVDHHHQNFANIDSGKNAGAQNLHGSEGQQPTPPHNFVTSNTGNNPFYQNPVNHVPFTQPPIYAAVPYYPTDTEPAFQNPYYPSNQSFPVPYIPHSDITDGNNVNHYPPSIYQGAESYGQPYPLYPQYMYPPSMYPTISSQNTPENWYAMPGQTPTMPVPHYVQYSPAPTSLPNSPNTHQNSNISK